MLQARLEQLKAAFTCVTWAQITNQDLKLIGSFDDALFCTVYATQRFFLFPFVSILRNRADCSRGTPVDVYSGGVSFESRP